MFKDGEEISPWVGLSFAALYLAAVAGVGAASLHVQRQELTRNHLQTSMNWAASIARHLTDLRENGPEAMAAEVRRIAREDSVEWCGIVADDRTWAIHSDSTQIGRPAEKLTPAELPIPGLHVLDGAPPSSSYVLLARMPGAKPETRGEELRVAILPAQIPWTQSGILVWAGYVLLAVLGTYLIFYRLFRRAVQPLAAIHRRLRNCQEPTAEGLLGLRLNDSFDQISTSWNRLIEFVAEMQEQLRRNKLSGDVTVAMDGFRSERLTNILMQIPFGVLLIDAERTVSFTNRTAAGMLSAAGEGIEGKPVSSLFDQVLCEKLFAAQPSNRTAQPATSRWTDHTFNRTHGEITLRFWSLASEACQGEYILFVQDITQAREAERARDQFLYHVTHELRTPLTNIRAYAETLSQGVIDDEQTIRECYNVIMGETQRLNRLVEDILNVSQLEVGTARLATSDVPIDQLLRKTVQDMQGHADAKNLDLVLSLPAKTPKIRGDRERLSVVFINLVGNAIKYTPEGGRVEVTCTPESDRLRIAVTDSGIGIDPANHERIFDKFFRVNDERVLGITGTGLGLAIVKETVRLHGGGVFVTSTPGKGSTFTVVLPTVATDESATQETAGAAAGREKA
ncbi:MAG: hypothetical protein AMXMBFR13_01390 [Phycisphaerae bacterium]